MNKMVFLLSSERSGSNLLRVIMDSHPKFSAPHSPHLINTFIPLLSSYGDLREQSRFTQLADDMRHVVNIQLRDWPYVPTTDQIIENAPTPSFSGLLHSLYWLAAKDVGKQHSFVKDNGVIPFAPELAILFPDAKFVYLVRDARDVALSWKKSPGHPGGVKDAARMWCKEQNEALHFISLVHSTGLLHVVHYEDLVGDPKKAIEAICNHLGEEFDARMLQFHKGKEAKTSAEAAVGWTNLVKPILNENTGKYRNALSRRKIRSIERIAGLPLLQLGYQLDHLPVPAAFGTDTIGKLFRAGRVAFKQLLRGPTGIKELKQRTKRLQGLRQITNRAGCSPAKWRTGPGRSQNETGQEE